MGGSKRFRVGERVRRSSNNASGYVHGVRTFLEEYKMRTEEEAQLFHKDVMSRYGHEFQKAYLNVLVMFGRRLMWIESNDLSVVESREGGES